MSHFYKKRAYRYPLYALMVVSFSSLALLTYFQWILGLANLLLLVHSMT